MKAAVVLLALPALLAGCMAGQPAAEAVPTGQIDGAVVDHLLRPYAAQPVHLVQLGLVDETSAFGGFTFREVPAGVYTLETSLAGGASATQLVDVEAGKVTRIILQLLPVPQPLPYFEAHPYTSPGERAQGGTPCESCEFAVPLDADRPREVTLEAAWDATLRLGGDQLGDDERYEHLNVKVTDGRGFALYEHRGVASPLSISIGGADIHPEATELRVQVEFGNEFLPGAQEFTMSSLLTTYFGGTKAELFGISP